MINCFLDNMQLKVIIITLIFFGILLVTLDDSSSVKFTQIIKEIKSIITSIIQILFSWCCVLSCIKMKIVGRKPIQRVGQKYSVQGKKKSRAVHSGEHGNEIVLGPTIEFLCTLHSSQSTGTTKNSEYGSRVRPNFTRTTKAPVGQGSWRQRTIVTLPARERIDKGIALRNEFDELIVLFSRNMEHHMRTKFKTRKTINLNMSAFLDKVIGAVEVNDKVYPDISQMLALEALCFLRLMRNATAHIWLSQFEEKDRIAWFLSAVLIVAGKKMMNITSVYGKAKILLDECEVKPSFKFPAKETKFQRREPVNAETVIAENGEIELSDRELDRLIDERNSFDRLIVDISRTMFKEHPTIDLDMPALLETITAQVKANKSPYANISKEEVLSAYRVLREMRNATEHILLSKIIQESFKRRFLSKVLIIAGEDMLNDKSICHKAAMLLKNLKREC